MDNWTDVGEAAKLDDGITYVERSGLRCVLFKSSEGIQAFSSLCPHLGGPMERAEIDGTIVSCPLHGWQFDLLDNGREINGYRALRMLDVAEVDGRLQVCQAVPSVA
jgi:nitrite reductase/ring-hydroxylating ferredoxin subunit